MSDCASRRGSGVIYDHPKRAPREKGMNPKWICVEVIGMMFFTSRRRSEIPTRNLLRLLSNRAIAPYRYMTRDPGGERLMYCAALCECHSFKFRTTVRWFGSLGRYIELSKKSQIYRKFYIFHAVDWSWFFVNLKVLDASKGLLFLVFIIGYCHS